MQNSAGTEVSYWHKSGTSGSANVLNRAMKNPDALAGGVEVQCAYEAGQLLRNYTPKGTRAAIAKAVAALSHALVAGLTGERAVGLVTIFSARLTEDQKAGIAYAALRSMANENAAYEVASLALFGTYRGEAVQ